MRLQASLQGSGGTGGQQTPPRPSRKITPALPRRTPLIPCVPIPSALQAAASGESNPVQLKLQQAFLDQYSAPHHAVRLSIYPGPTSSERPTDHIWSSLGRDLPLVHFGGLLCVVTQADQSCHGNSHLTSNLPCKATGCESTLGKF